MNMPLATAINGHALPGGSNTIEPRSPELIFSGHCEARAMRVVEGILSICEATDELQGYAKLARLVEAIGQDKIQEIMSEAFAMAEATFDEFEREMTVRASDRIRQWELDDPRDAWRHTGEAPLPLALAPPIRPKPYHTPQSTIDAFFYVIKTKDAAGIADWLADHPRDEKYLQKIWEQKCSTAAAK